MPARIKPGLLLGMVLATHGAYAQEAGPALAQTGSGPGSGNPVSLSAVLVEGRTPENNRIDDPRQSAASSKTGTALEDLPSNIQVIPHALLAEQGATVLRDAVYNASGINFGGQDSKGYYDHFLIRGLNAQIYSDGFSDGDELSGLSHSLNGVERVEILEGPGSALFGSGPPGGTINLVHYTPSSSQHYGGSVQGGSFGTIANSDYVTGPTGVAGLDYRLDATFSHSYGFRKLASHDYEGRPGFQWR